VQIQSLPMPITVVLGQSLEIKIAVSGSAMLATSSLGRRAARVPLGSRRAQGILRVGCAA
jgi:hypothetical protein